MGLVAYFSLWATALAWILTRGQGSHLQWMGDAVAVSWIACKVAHWMLGPQFRQALPLHEFVMLLFVAGLVVAEAGRLDFRAAAWWKAAVFCTVLAQACVWIGYPYDEPLAMRAPFLIALNVLGFTTLGVIITAGVRPQIMA